MAKVPKKSKYKTLVRIEERGADRQKTIIKAGTVLNLTPAEAERFGSMVVPVKESYVPDPGRVADAGDDGAGAAGGEGGGDGGGAE